jgi:hypothetical protein
MNDPFIFLCALLLLAAMPIGVMLRDWLRSPLTTLAAMKLQCQFLNATTRLIRWFVRLLLALVERLVAIGKKTTLKSQQISEQAIRMIAEEMKKP